MLQQHLEIIVRDKKAFLVILSSIFNVGSKASVINVVIKKNNASLYSNTATDLKTIKFIIE